jgi:hypothetical protein
MDSEKNPERETPKTQTLPGFIETRYIKCGRSNCHCTTGKGHGPYHYWVYKSGNRKFKKYVKRDDLPIISARIDERRRQAQKATELSREARLRLQIFKGQLKEFKKLTGI